MNSDSPSSAIANLERAASTHEMTNAAKQIADIGAFSHARLVHALAAAAHWVSDAESATAWARLTALTFDNQPQTAKDAFATHATVAAFSQLAVYATTPESIQWMARAICSITNSTTQATKDAFASPAIAAAFSQLAAHATTPESVQWLTRAIYSITNGTAPSALLSTVEPVQMSVDCLVPPPQADNAVPEPPPGYGLKCYHPKNGSFVVSLGAGAYVTIMSLVLYVHKAYCPLRQMLQLEWVGGESTVNESYEAGFSPEWKKGGITYTFSAPYPTSVRVVILHSNDYPTYSPQIHTLTLRGERPLLTTQDMFASPAIVAAFSQLAPHATTPESIQWMAHAISSITNSTTQATKDVFGTFLVASFVQLARYATTAEAVQCLTAAIFNITDGTMQASKDAFASPAIVAAFVQLAHNATTPESVQSLTRAICSIANSATQATKDLFATPEIVSALRSLSTFATGPPHLTLDPTLAAVSQHQHAAQPVVPPISGAVVVSAARGILPGYAADHLGVDCILKQALIVFPPNYHPPCNAHDAIVQCGLSGVTNLPLIARESAAMAANRLANLPPVAGGGPCRLEPGFAIAIAAYTYDLGFSSADPTGAGTDNFYCCINAALRQRAQDGTGLRQLRPILFYLLRGLESLPAAVNTVVYRGVPSSCTDVVRQLYVTGKDVYWTSFTSASEKIDAAMQFALKERSGGVIFQIVSVTGRYVKWYSSIPREGEVIFSPNSSFNVSQGPHDEVLNGCTMCVVNLTERRQESVVY